MTPSKEELSALIEMVRGLKGADREVDGAIEVEARRQDAYRAGLDDNSRAKWKHNGCTVFDGNTGYDAPRFTGSVDAALALVERVQPGWSYEITKTKYCIAEMWLADEEGFVGGVSPHVKPVEAPTLPLAIILALLLSLQSQEPTP